MCLDDAVFVQGSSVAYLDHVPLEEAGRVEVDAAPDSCAEQPEVPWEKRRAVRRFERERRGKELVERVHELQAPNEIGPERALEGPKTSHDGPLRKHYCAGHGSAASRIDQRQQQDRGAG